MSIPCRRFVTNELSAGNTMNAHVLYHSRSKALGLSIADVIVRVTC